MKIAILGWGSLVWDPRELPREGIWQMGGPSLLLEFSRVSMDCRLTLVIDPTNGQQAPTRFVMSPRADIDDTICDLRVRECTTTRNIGFVDVREDADRARDANVCGAIKAWCQGQGLDGVVWTDLAPNFKEQTGTAYSVDKAVEYLKRLPKAGREAAYRYIRNAPDEVVTPLRTRLNERGLLQK